MKCYTLQPPSGLHELLGHWTNELLVGLRCWTFPGEMWRHICSLQIQNYTSSTWWTIDFWGITFKSRGDSKAAASPENEQEIQPCQFTWLCCETKDDFEKLVPCLYLPTAGIPGMHTATALLSALDQAQGPIHTSQAPYPHPQSHFTLIQWWLEPLGEQDLVRAS